VKLAVDLDDIAELTADEIEQVDLPTNAKKRIFARAVEALKQEVCRTNERANANISTTLNFALFAPQTLAAKWECSRHSAIGRAR